MMNVYEIDIWYGVRHNGTFSHNVRRCEVIHALNEERAKRRITLAKEKTQMIGTLNLEVSGESIYAIKKTGTVVKKMYYVYSDGRNPRPVQ